MHGSKHLYERISWIKDLDGFINNNTINWDHLVQKAQTIHAQKMLLVSLYLTHRLFDTKLPNAVLKKMTETKSISKIAMDILEGINTQSEKLSKANFFILINLHSGVPKKIEFVIKSLLYPKYSDLTFVKLPKALYFLYPFLRVFRLMKKMAS